MAASQKSATSKSRIIDSDERQSVTLRMKDVNELFICKLCDGYLIEPHTITECLHTFCKSCVVKHVRDSIECPTCNSIIHPSYPLEKILPDHAIEAVINEMVPNLQIDELERQQNFWKKRYKRVPKRIVNKLRNLKRDRPQTKVIQHRKCITPVDCDFKAFLLVELKPYRIDESFDEDSKVMEERFLCVPFEARASNIMNLIASKMDLNEEQFEVVLILDNFELKPSYPLRNMKKYFFENSDRIVLFYSIIVRIKDTDDSQQTI